MPSLPPNSLPAKSLPLRAEALLRRRLRRSFHDFAKHCLGPLGQRPASHHRRLIADLQAISAGRIDRLMVLMPPGSAKSTYGSILFPAWFLAAHPRASVIAVAHTADLARHFARQVRGNAVEQRRRLGFAVLPNGPSGFLTSTGGSYFATGMRGPMTGRRADLVLIDDPIKSQAEADRQGMRDQAWAWFRSDLLTRLRPGGRIVLIMTRWHPDDLAGRLLVGGDNWRVLRLPALAEAEDPLGRPPGAPLWPAWEDADSLARKRTTMGERAWAALYQQDPRPSSGGLFTPARIAVLRMPPPLQRVVRAWDLAATAGDRAADPDWSVGVKLGLAETGLYVVLDVIRLRAGPAGVEAAIQQAASADGRAVPIGLPQDPGQAGRAQILYLARGLAGHIIVASPETGSKLIRAMPVAAQADAGNLGLLQAPWNQNFLEEMQDFPHGAKDDQIDALARAFGMLTASPAPARRMNLPILGR